jgi:hypothetical protein
MDIVNVPRTRTVVEFPGSRILPRRGVQEDIRDIPSETI